MYTLGVIFEGQLRAHIANPIRRGETWGLTLDTATARKFGTPADAQCFLDARHQPPLILPVGRELEPLGIVRRLWG